MLVPSRFEPCGLTQLYALRYGTVPVVTKVGGLVDTVTDLELHPESGTGLMFDPTEAGLLSALERAMSFFADRPRLAAAQRRAMNRDFSWRRAAVAYERLYQDSL